jgi:enoyl-CoA hydratase
MSTEQQGDGLNEQVAMVLSTDRMIAVKEAGIGWITFNNPARRNAISVDMRLALIEILTDFQRDPAVRVVVMKGAGDKAFVSGSDISEFKERRATPEQADEYRKASEALDRAFEALEKPLIAMIRGACLGAGLGTALKADMRVSAADAQFGIPAGRLGIVYNYPGLKRVVEVVGPASAMEMIFTARRFSADEALKMGLVHEVTQPDLLETRVRELSATIARNAPLSVRAGKLMIKEMMKDPADRNMAMCAALVKEAFASEDYREGRTAFMEKREPQFKGR